VLHIFSPEILLLAVRSWQHLTVLAVQLLTVGRVSPLLCILRHRYESWCSFVQCIFNSIIGADSRLSLIVQVLTTAIDEDLAVDLLNGVVNNVLGGLCLPLLLRILVVLCDKVAQLYHFDLLTRVHRLDVVLESVHLLSDFVFSDR